MSEHTPDAQPLAGDEVAAIERENSLFVQHQLGYLQQRVAELTVDNQRLRNDLAAAQQALAMLQNPLGGEAGDGGNGEDDSG